MIEKINIQNAMAYIDDIGELYFQRNMKYFDIALQNEIKFLLDLPHHKYSNEVVRIEKTKKGGYTIYTNMFSLSWEPDLYEYVKKCQENVNADKINLSIWIGS